MPTILTQSTADAQSRAHYPTAIRPGGRGAAPRAPHTPSAETATEKPLDLDERPMVLIVEDDASIADLIGDVLESARYRTVRARNGRVALAVARRERPAVVLTDLMMPEIDGAEFIRRMRSNAATSHIPIVMMSSVRPNLATSGAEDTSARRPDQRVLRELPQAQYTRVGDEAIPFLAKPFDIDDLVDVVDALVRATSDGDANANANATYSH